MFYPSRMGLRRSAAHAGCSAIVAAARRFGGALVTNWHDRSLAVERQWGKPYENLLDEIEREPVWFAGARDAVEWFQWRRSIRFVAVDDPDQPMVAVEAPELPAYLPAGCVVLWRGRDVEERVIAGREHTMEFPRTPAVAVS
jgi:hypothetical protein